MRKPATKRDGRASTEAAKACAVMKFVHELLSYVVEPFLWNGALLAVEIAALAMVGGFLLGLGLALLRLSRFGPVRSAAWTYIWFIRGTPQLLQLVFLYDALPSVGIKLDSFTTAVLGFALNEAAFSAEIIRGGILSVNRNQGIAAAAFGMGHLLTMRRIILPQAMRAILPGLANDSIAVLKGTSIASVIFVNELTFRSQQIVGQNFKFFTVFTATGIIYLALTSAIAAVQWVLERRFNIEIERPARSEGALARMFGLRRPETESSAEDSLAAKQGREPIPGGPVADSGHAWLSSLSEGAGAGVSDRVFVSCADVWKSYSGREVLRGVDLTVRRGEVVTIMGPSGSGKSTLLRLINHLEAVDKGEILVDGRPLAIGVWASPATHSRFGVGARRGANRHGVPALQLVRPLHRAREHRRGARSRLSRGSCEGAGDRDAPSGSGWARSPRQPSSPSTLRRSATTRRDRARARDFAASDAVR